jgi:hypothetical protein
MTITVGSGVTPGAYPITVTGTGTGPTTHSVTYTLTVPPPGINNGGFEAGDFSFWNIVTGTASISTCRPHSGNYAAWLGGETNNDCIATATSGDSSISQTFAPQQAGTLSFWYDESCPDTLTNDWATATLTDNTASTVTTLLPKTCTNTKVWTQVSTAVGSSSVGHNLTLTLTNHDDNNSTNPTVTMFDDVALTQTQSADFSVSAAPGSQTVTAGASTIYTATIAPIAGFTGAVTMSLSGLPSGASGSFNPSPVTGGSGSSTLNVTTTSATPGGSYPVTITGTSGTTVHSTTVTLVVQNFSVSMAQTNLSIKRGSKGTDTVTLTPQQGFTGSVTLSLSGLPSGATGTFNPSSPSINGSPANSTLTIATGTAAVSSYLLTITGTSGGLVHSTTVTLTIRKH